MQHIGLWQVNNKTVVNINKIVVLGPCQADIIILGVAVSIRNYIDIHSEKGRGIGIEDVGDEALIH